MAPNLLTVKTEMEPQGRAVVIRVVQFCAVCGWVWMRLSVLETRHANVFVESV